MPGAAEEMNMAGMRAVVVGVMAALASAPAPASSICPADIVPVGPGDNVVNLDDFLYVLGHWGQTGGPADIYPYPFGDAKVDVLDFLTVLAEWGPCPAPAPQGVCCYGDGNYVGGLDENFCLQSGGLAFMPNAGGAESGGPIGGFADADNDRIPDVFELNNCMQAGDACFVPTNPNNPDTDGDALEDGDEKFGGNTVPLHQMGANPCKKNIFVEADWVRHPGNANDHNRPHPNQVARVVTAFANSPVTNPNGTTGVIFLIDYGQGAAGGCAACTGGNQIIDTNGRVDIPANDNNPDGLEGEFKTFKTANFNQFRQAYFHYLILCDGFSEDGTNSDASGVAELPGDDFIVSWGDTASGDDGRIGNTIMHELGHNLQLRHGGFSDTNRKPNYNSVMNYRFQNVGIDTGTDALPDGFGAGALSYSTGVRIDLNENALLETNGINGADDIDWNADGMINAAAYPLNINCPLNGVMNTGERCGTQGDCDDSTCNILADNNDWASLVYTGIYTSPDLVDVEIEIIVCMPKALAPLPGVQK
jgi:hypothetical protein